MSTQLLDSPSASDISEALKEGDIPENATEMTILLLAYIREKEIQKFYRNSQKRIVSSVARNVLNQLSRQKRQHQNVLKTFYDELQAKNNENESIEEASTHYSLPMQTIAQHADFLEVCQLALELEKKCHDFFEDALNTIKNNSMAKAFKFLINNEKKYLEYLVYQFCTCTE
ncbi:hypothetical protein JXJ21_23355 [candidate division KSB1 bacterium]|nr:hypothetical protein [candidate division KSB1 bacterium]